MKDPTDAIALLARDATKIMIDRQLAYAKLASLYKKPEAVPILMSAIEIIPDTPFSEASIESMFPEYKETITTVDRLFEYLKGSRNDLVPQLAGHFIITGPALIDAFYLKKRELWFVFCRCAIEDAKNVSSKFFTDNFGSFLEKGHKKKNFTLADVKELEENTKHLLRIIHSYCLPTSKTIELLTPNLRRFT